MRTRVLALGRFGARLGRALVEVSLAALVLSGSVILGHELREWREWYGAPTTAHPWAPTPRPSPTALVAER